MDKNALKTYKYRQLFTETYLSSATNGEEGQILDKNVYKAIKENNVEYLVEKQPQNFVQGVQAYDQEGELTSVTIEIRKRYDLTKIETSKLQKTIANLEEQRQYLNTQIEKAQKEAAEIKNNHDNIESKHLTIEESLEYLEYMKDIRLNMEQRLKSDILHYKKQCFDDNIVLIRLKTTIKQLSQKNNSKKHLQSKSKLLLNTLQQTVKMRETERDNHLKQVKTVLMRKIQNTEIKANREQQIEQSMNRAMTERLPEQKFLLKKLYTELFLRRILRNKMNKLIQQYKDVQYAFNNIKKQTKIATVSDFIEDYLGKDQKYGNLLHSIQKNQKKIAQEKRQYEILIKQKAKLELESAAIDQDYSTINHKKREDGEIYKRLVYYNEQVIKCEELKIMLNRWASRTVSSFNALTSGRKHHQHVSQIEAPKSIDSLKEIISKAINQISHSLNQNEKQIATPEKKSQLQTEFSEEKINLRMLTEESVLTKEFSRKNFRVRTMTAHEQAPNDHDNEYDDLSEYDFLKHNRRIVKKNNIKSQRHRIKTRPF